MMASPLSIVMRAWPRETLGSLMQTVELGSRPTVFTPVDSTWRRCPMRSERTIEANPTKAECKIQKAECRKGGPKMRRPGATEAVRDTVARSATRVARGLLLNPPDRCD